MVEEIDVIYKRFLSIVMIAMMHLSKKFESKNKKDFASFVNDLFYNDVLMNVQFTYKNSSIIRDIISQYTKRSTYYNSAPKAILNLYFGEFDENNRREGFGRISFDNGDRYEGEWSNDLMHGFGVYI